MALLRQAWRRIAAIVAKEFFEIRRDRLTIVMLFAIPLVNLCILGLSVNTDPRQVRSALLDYDASPLSRTLITGMANTDYFSFTPLASEAEADRLFRQGKVQIVVQVPAGFSRDLLAGKRPQLLVQTDATDPAATANATQALVGLMDNVFDRDLQGISSLRATPQPLAELVLHKRFNPENVVRLNVVPGLTGVILSIVMILMSSLSIIREREKGSLVHLINSPISAGEIILGKTLPYFLLGAALVMLFLLIACRGMSIPLAGSWLSLAVLFALFIVLCLATGVIFSSITRSQLQAMQLTSFYFLLSTMLSGFMTPFFGMPGWSQALGALLPLTYFLRLSRGVMLKGYTLSEMGPDFAALLALTAASLLLSVYLFRRSLSR